MRQCLKCIHGEDIRGEDTVCWRMYLIMDSSGLKPVKPYKCSNLKALGESSASAEAPPTEKGMKNCRNIEHKKPCLKEEVCPHCGISTCSPNYAYHLCIRGEVKE